MGVKISLCMIVKNESKNIERCLNSVKGHVYEMIVVDTGSNDNTAELAAALGARVYHFELTDDFSAARNFSISKAKGDWILVLDADEYLTQPYIENMNRVTAELSKALELDKNTPRVILIAVANLDKHGTNYLRSEALRIFKRDPRIQYFGRVHENVGFTSGEQLIYYNAISEIMLTHTGYTDEAYAATGKMERNEKLLLAELDCNPDDPFVYSHLGDVYESKEDYKSALNCYKRALELYGDKENGFSNNKLYFHIIQDMIFLDYKEAELLQIYEKAAASCSQSIDFDFKLGEYYRLRNNHKAAMTYYDKAIEKIEKGADKTFSLLITKIPLLYRAAIDTAIELENWIKATEYMACLLKANKYDMRLLKVFLTVLLLHSGAATDEILALLLSIFDKSNPKDKLYLYKTTQLCADMPNAHELLGLVRTLFSTEESAMLDD